jgi:hypothetical protein
MSVGFTESDADEAALGWLESLGYTVRHGPEIAYNTDGGERTDPAYRDTILQSRLHRALTRLNPGLPGAAVADAYRKLLRVEAGRPTPIRGPSSVTTSAFTTASARSSMARPYRSTTKAGWQSSN